MSDPNDSKNTYREAEAGALWSKKKNGKVFYSGQIVNKKADGSVQKKDIIVFENKFKAEGDNKPEFNIYWTDKLPGREADAAPKPPTKPAPPKPKSPPPQADPDDDVPM